MGNPVNNSSKEHKTDLRHLERQHGSLRLRRLWRDGVSLVGTAEQTLAAVPDLVVPALDLEVVPEVRRLRLVHLVGVLAHKPVSKINKIQKSFSFLQNSNVWVV